MNDKIAMYLNITDPQTRLDRYLETMGQEIVSPETVGFLFGDDVEEARAQLERWKARHDEKHGSLFHIVDSKHPEIIKITITPPDISIYDRNMHSRNLQKARRRGVR